MTEAERIDRQNAETTAAHTRSDVEQRFLEAHRESLSHIRDREIAIRSRAAGLVYPGLALLVLVSSKAYRIEHPLVIGSVFALLLLLGVIRTVVAVRFEQLQAEDPGRAIVTLSTVTLVSGLVWGLFAGLTVELFGTEQWATMIVVVCSAGLLAGSSTTLALHRTLHWLFLAVVFIPLTVSCLLAGGQGMILTFVFLMYAAVLAIEGRNIGEEYWSLLTRTELLESARDEAQSASEAKSMFLANMSHEIRTPMNAILGMTDILLSSNLASEEREQLFMVKSSAETLLALVDDILDFSKVEAGRLDLDNVPILLRATIGETLKALGVRAQERGLELVLDVEDDVPDHLIGDPVRIRQVLVNLVGNGIKFTHDGYVAVRVWRRDVKDDHAIVQVDVTDTGVGIPIDRQTSIFESFTQADISTTRKYGGTGLGLSISSALVELMGGRIWLQSQSGQGSTFSFTLRLKLPADAPSGYSAQPKTQTDGLRVLIADPNRISAAALAGQLERIRVEAMRVAEHAEAVELARAAMQAGKPFSHFFVDSRLVESRTGPRLGDLIDSAELGRPVIVLMRMGPRRYPHPLRRSSDPTEYEDVSAANLRVVQKPLLPMEIRACLDARWLGPDSVHPFDGPNEAAAGLPARILLAEDNPVNVLVARRLLERLGFDVTHAGDGETVVEKVKAGDFDLILMDLHMPGLDGLAATIKIREHEREHGGHIPIVALTARVMGDDKERCLAAGMDGYATKPFRPDELKGVIDDLLESTRRA